MPYSRRRDKIRRMRLAEILRSLIFASGAEITAPSCTFTLTGSNLLGVNEKVVTKSADYTLTTEDSGAVVVVTGVDKVMTLPATALGLKYTFVLAAAGLSAGTGLSISPAAADKIMGNGFTSADNKDAILAGATDREGDVLTIVGDGADGWYITEAIGTWSREA